MMLPTHAQLTRECAEAMDSLDACLARLKAEPIYPDVDAMITRPAATVAGSVDLLTATMEALRCPAPPVSLDDVARAAVEGGRIGEVV